MVLWQLPVQVEDLLYLVLIEHLLVVHLQGHLFLVHCRLDRRKTLVLLRKEFNEKVVILKRFEFCWQVIGLLGNVVFGFDFGVGLGNGENVVGVVNSFLFAGVTL
jgi:membrane-anchored glycerophosphoryl diester phosphodiesterase (GDPDase)